MQKSKEISNGVVSYFKESSQWQKLVSIVEQSSEEEIYHIHMYTRSSIAADSLLKLVRGYYKCKGMELDRKIDLVSPTPGLVGLHNIHPFNPDRSFIPSIDFWWRYKENVALEAAPPSEGEDGKNLIAWGKSYMDEFNSKFDFKTVGPKEEKKIRDWFKSAHWKKALRLVEDPYFAHVHVNVEINFDPWILKMFVCEELSKIGWKIDHVYPCVYHIPRGYQGKIVFLTGYPEEVWDICWEYNPNVIIRPAQIEFAGSLLGDGDISFDVWPKKYVDDTLKKDPYVSLTDEEINRILQTIC